MTTEIEFEVLVKYTMPVEEALVVLAIQDEDRRLAQFNSWIGSHFAKGNATFYALNMLKESLGATLAGIEIEKMRKVMH